MEKKPYVSILFTIAAIVLAIVKFDWISEFATKLFAAFSPFLIGAFIAFVINIPTSFFEKKISSHIKNKTILKLKKSIGFFLSLIIIFLILSLVLAMVIPQAITSAGVLMEKAPEVYDAAWDFVEHLAIKNPDLKNQALALIPDPAELIPKITKNLSIWVGGAASFVGGIAGTLLNLLIAMIFSIYLVFRKEKMIENLNLIADWIIGEKYKEKLKGVLNISNTILHNYIVGQVAEAFILGGLMFIGMTVCMYPYPAMISSLMGLLALIPMVGAVVGGILGAIIIATENLTQGLTYVIFFMVIQQLEGNLIYPRVVGSQVGLPALWVLFAVVVGSALFGIIGTFFGVPVMAIIYTIVIRKSEEHKLKKLGVEK